VLFWCVKPLFSASIFLKIDFRLCWVRCGSLLVCGVIIISKVWFFWYLSWISDNTRSEQNFNSQCFLAAHSLSYLSTITLINLIKSCSSFLTCYFRFSKLCFSSFCLNNSSKVVFTFTYHLQIFMPNPLYKLHKFSISFQT
jgi:hypothetical protein